MLIKITLFCFSLLSLLINSCNQSPILDYSKIDTAFFIGKYQTNYRGEIETIDLKKNGLYDYSHGKYNDVFIKDAGEWSYSKESEWISFTNFPNIRVNKVYEDENGKTYNIAFNIDSYSDGLGDLYTADYEDSRYIFVKLDKSINNKYLSNY